MSGFVFAFGRPERSALETALKKITHRGPDLSGIFESNGVIMAQNYLQADGVAVYDGIEVPLCSPSDEKLRICYDGQMGNWKDVAQTEGILDGPFREERLLLQLYKTHGKGMFQYLTDAIAAFVISDGNAFLAARDLLGIKTLFYGWKAETLYVASELKSILTVTEDVHEFPPGYYMDSNGRLTPFATLPTNPPGNLHADPDHMAEEIREIIRRSIDNRLDFHWPLACLLSGGIDSSVIAYLANEVFREMFGKGARLKTFALGAGESADIKNARIMARHINSDHHELIVDLEEILAVLPEVIYYLESFDPSLVRSSISNFLISKYASEQGIQVLLSGEGGDEIFCGYSYLKNFPLEELFTRQMECLGFLHNNASLRLDRMNQCHGVRVVAPLVSGELLNYSFAIPPEGKQNQGGEQRIEKWIFRKAFEALLPEQVVWRSKQEFSQGSGSAHVLANYFENVITDNELAEFQTEYPVIRSKEELYYFRIFTEHFGTGQAVKTVGQWICL